LRDEPQNGQGHSPTVAYVGGLPLDNRVQMPLEIALRT
jgi:hypothetical protein